MTTLCNNLTIDNYKTLVADCMFMTGYSAYCEGYELQPGFSMDNLDAPHWIAGGSTKHIVGGSFIISSAWVSLSNNRIS